MKNEIKKYKLSIKEIDKSIFDIQKKLRSKRHNNQEIASTCVLAEEALMAYEQKENGYDHFSFKYSGGLNPTVCITIPGESFCPYSSDDEFRNIILQQLSQSHKWGYKNGCNIIKIRLNANPLKSIIWSLLGIILGAIFALCLPNDIAASTNEVLVKPISDLILKIIWCVGCLLVFTNIILSIYNIGNLNKLKSLFKWTMIVILAFLILDSVLTSIFTIPFFSFSADSSTGTEDSLKSYVEFFISFCPKDIFTPFIEGNAMQVLVLSTVIGIICLVLNKAVKNFVRFVEQIDLIFKKLMGAIEKIIPILVFTLIYSLVTENDTDTIAQSLSVIIVLAAIWVVVMLATMIFICIFCKINVKDYLSKVTRPILIGLFTSSIFASMETNTKVCTKYLNVNKELCGIGLPITQIFYKAFMNISLLAIAIVFASVFGVDVSYNLPILALYCILLSISAPPIPGGLIPVVSLMFAQFGIPTDYLGLAISVVILFDPLGSSLGISAQQKVLVVVDRILKKTKTR